MTKKTEEGKCPKCNETVEYEGTMDIDAWPCIAHPCTCPKCKWEGNEVSKAVFVEMETFEREIIPLKPQALSLPNK